MPRSLAVAVALVAAFGLPAADRPAEVVALQKALHQIQEANENSVGCVLVSRSKKYAEMFGDAPSESRPGKLGEFRPPLRRTPFGPPVGRDPVGHLDLSIPQVVPDAYGSGLAIDDRGLVLTNAHVIEGATKIFVRFPGRDRGSYADIVASDARSDLAVLKMIRPPGDLRAVKFGDGGAVRKADLIIALTNPYASGISDGSTSVSIGVVSNVRRAAGLADPTRRGKPLAQYRSLIQTDARLAVGSSGGAIINLDGEVVGLTTALAPIGGGDGNAGYAIPIDTNVKKMIEVLKRGEEVEYGFLGVTVGNADIRVDNNGVTISDAPLGMPAARAGLVTGDTVVSINGQPIRDQDDLFFHIASALAGTEADVEVRRMGQVQKFRVRLAKAARAAAGESFLASQRPLPVHGIRVDYASTQAVDANLPEGVLLKEIEKDSPADRNKDLTDLRNRYSILVVVGVNGRPTPTPADFYRAAAGKSPVTLEVVSGDRGDSARKRISLP